MAKRFTKQEAAGAIVAERLADYLISNHAEQIIELYTAGKTRSEISSKYCNSVLSPSVGINAVSFALEKLLSKEERRIFEKAHKRANGRNRAKSFTGIFQKASARANVLSRGLVPYDGEARETEFGLQTEEEYVTSLKNSENYDFRGGWSRMTDKVNSIFGNSRDREEISNKYFRWKNECSRR